MVRKECSEKKDSPSQSSWELRSRGTRTELSWEVAQKSASHAVRRRDASDAQNASI